MEINKIKKTYEQKIISYNDFLNESYDIDYRNDRYALVRVGGSIGNYPKYPILISGTIGSCLCLLIIDKRHVLSIIEIK